MTSPFRAMFDYQCKLLRVVDGDTIDVHIDLGFSVWHKARVRMLGIDTPESRTRNLAEKALGKASSARLKDCLLYTSPSPRDGLLSRMPSSA